MAINLSSSKFSFSDWIWWSMVTVTSLEHVLALTLNFNVLIMAIFYKYLSDDNMESNI